MLLASFFYLAGQPTASLKYGQIARRVILLPFAALISGFPKRLVHTAPRRETASEHGIPRLSLPLIPISRFPVLGCCFLISYFLPLSYFLVFLSLGLLKFTPDYASGDRDCIALAQWKLWNSICWHDKRRKLEALSVANWNIKEIEISFNFRQITYAKVHTLPIFERWKVIHLYREIYIVACLFYVSFLFTFCYKIPRSTMRFPFNVQKLGCKFMVQSRTRQRGPVVQIKILRVAVAFRRATNVCRAIKKSSRPMPSSRHAGQLALGCGVCIHTRQGALCRARSFVCSFVRAFVRSFSRQEAGAVGDDLPRALCSLACSRNVPLVRTTNAPRGRGIERRG